MKTSGIEVFLHCTLTNGDSNKTYIMTPANARIFLDVAFAHGVEFATLFMDRAENF